MKVMAVKHRWALNSRWVDIGGIWVGVDADFSSWDAWTMHSRWSGYLYLRPLWTIIYRTLDG